MPWAAAAGAATGFALNSAFGGSKPSGSATSTTNTSPWGGQQPYLADVFSQASGLHGRGPLQYYPGQTLASQSPYTQQSVQRMAGSATDPNSLTNQSLGEWGKTVRGDYLDPSSNPYLKSSIDDALGQAQGRVAGLFGARGGNNYGSSAHEEWLGRTLANTALPIYAQNYQTERGRQLNAAQLGPSVEAQGSAGLTQAGQTTDAYQQALIGADKARFDFGQTSPWNTLGMYSGLVNGNYGGASTSTNPYFGGNPLLSALGGASAGLGIYGQGKQAGLWGGGMAGNTYDPSQNYLADGGFSPYYSGYGAYG